MSRVPNGALRSLVVAHTAPWPPDSGGKIRLDLATRGLAAEGPVDVFAFAYGSSEPIDVVARFGWTRRPRPPSTGVLSRARWLTTTRQPLELTDLRTKQARTAFAAFVDDQHYDFVWFSLPLTFAVHGHQIEAATVLDCHDLEHYKHAAREESVRPTLDTVRSASARFSSSVNISRWESYYRRVHDVVGQITVCSTIDDERLGLPNVTVIPNGFARPDHRAGDEPKGDRSPTIIFPGTMTYGPNADAAAFLVAEIAPLLAERIADVRVRIVGMADHRATRLHAPPLVEVTGRVESMAEELARADLVAVPIRFGSGTRLKILEAFAHRLPVVSTTLGAEGLGIVHRETALLADTPSAFADACAELLADDALRSRLVHAAEQLFLSKFEAEAIEREVGALARELVSKR